MPGTPRGCTKDSEVDALLPIITAVYKLVCRHIYTGYVQQVISGSTIRSASAPLMATASISDGSFTHVKVLFVAARGTYIVNVCAIP